MPYHMMTPRFPLGKTYATPGALALDVELRENFFLHEQDTSLTLKSGKVLKNLKVLRISTVELPMDCSFLEAI